MEGRQVFKQFNRFMLMMWRLGLGSWVNGWPDVGGRILVLTTTGRKSGVRRRTPVNYAEVDGEIYCTAGFGSSADWYRNLKANPQVEVWLPDSWWQAEAEDVSAHPERLKLMRQVLIASGFATVFAGLDPRKAPDEELDQKTADYALVRLKRTAPRTGPGGPGDLAWVWPAAVFVMLPLLLRRRRRSCSCCGK